MKFLAKICVIVLVIGGVLFAAGQALGGRLYSSWQNGYLNPWHFGRDRLEYTIDRIGDSFDDALDRVEDSLENKFDRVFDDVTGHDKKYIPSSNSFTSFSSNSVRRLDFDLKQGSYIITRGEEFSISPSNGVDHWIEENTWYITSRKGEKNRQDTITITLPQTFSPQKFELHLSEGSGELCTLSADQVDLQIGSGHLITQEITANQIDLEVGAGRFESGILSCNKIEADIGMGQADIFLAGAEKDYKYYFEAGMGSISLNDNSILSELSGETSFGDGSHKVDISVGMGNVALHTQSN